MIRLSVPILRALGSVFSYLRFIRVLTVFKRIQVNHLSQSIPFGFEMRDEKFVKFWSFIRCGDGEASLSAAVTWMKRPAWAPLAVIAGAIMVCTLSRTLSRIYKIRSIRPGTIRVLDYSMYLCRTILHRSRNEANGVVKFPWTNGSTILLMNNV